MVDQLGVDTTLEHMHIAARITVKHIEEFGFEEGSNVATPHIRAMAKDTADALDNTLSALHEEDRAEVLECVLASLQYGDRVLARAIQDGGEPLAAYSAFVAKVREYLPEDYLALLA